MRIPSTLFAAAMLLWVGLAGLPTESSDDAKPKSMPTAKVAGGEATTPDVKLRAKIHETMMALCAARAAEKPNPTKIAKLTKRLQSLRAKLGPVGQCQLGTAPACAQCPYGGPGLGAQRGRGCRFGNGGGPGWGRGRGCGRGGGCGRCAQAVADPPVCLQCPAGCGSCVGCPAANCPAANCPAAGNAPIGDAVPNWRDPSR